MSLSSALNNAVSGLAASARAVQVVSSNIANAMTDGYATRHLDLAASTLDGVGTGVRILGVHRQTDPVLDSLLREAAGRTAHDSTQAKFWNTANTALGGADGGVSAALSRFETALISASARPDLSSHLKASVNSAQSVVKSLATAETSIQSSRSRADAAIDTDVQALNTGLTRVHELNSQIVRLTASGASTLGLRDERDAMIATLSEIVPIIAHLRSNDSVSLFTTSGLQLLDLKPAELKFSKTLGITAEMNETNALSGLTIGNRAIDTGSNGPLSGGRLAANFAVRDVAAVEAQSELDALAGNLITRFANPATDPTLSIGDAGLFTDAGGLAQTMRPGIAGRLTLNSVVLASGGETRIRDGIGAAGPGPVGDAAQFQRLLDTLHDPQAPLGGGPSLSLFSLSQQTNSHFAQQLYNADSTAAVSAARNFELTEQRLANGVDTDAEMQRLLTLEQSYAANARLIQTADAMIQRLLEI